MLGIRGVHAMQPNTIGVQVDTAEYHGGGLMQPNTMGVVDRRTCILFLYVCSMSNQCTCRYTASVESPLQDFIMHDCRDEPPIDLFSVAPADNQVPVGFGWPVNGSPPNHVLFGFG